MIAWLTLTLLLATSGGDAVILRTGERVEGQILEAGPDSGVTLRLPDGRTRWLHPLSVERIERADGSSAPLAPPPRSDTQPLPAFEPLRPEELIRPRPAPAPADGPEHGVMWFAFGAGTARPLGRSAKDAPALSRLVGDSQPLLTFEAGLRVNERDSIGAVLDVTFANVGPAVLPACERYGTECDTATAQLGLFARRDFAPHGRWNPWASIGIGREWLSGEVFAPSGGGDSVTVLSASGWQLPRVGLGIDWRGSSRFGLGLYTTVAAGVYDHVTLDGVELDRGAAVHGWAQFGLRGIFGP